MRKRLLVLTCAVVLPALLPVGALFADPQIYLKARSFDPRSASIETSSASTLGPGHFVVQFSDPVGDDERRRLEASGMRVLCYLPDNAFIVKSETNTAAASALREKARNVRWIGKLLADDRIEPGLRSVRAAQTVVIHLFDGESRGTVISRIKRLGGGVFPTEGDLIKAVVPPGAIAKLAELESIAWIEKWHQPKLCNDIAGGIIGAPPVWMGLGLYGAGQILGISDTGLDTGNTATVSLDFSGKIVAAWGLRRPGDWRDLCGHGTHVAGSALGFGALSGANPAMHQYAGSFAGIAPDASVAMQSVDDGSGTIYPPMDIGNLFEQTYAAGARVHACAWGTETAGAYTTYSQQTDRFMWTHRDMLLIFAAGNGGVDADANGVVDTGSVYAPASAKNCLAVGATESETTRGYQSTYGLSWASRFPAVPISSDYISDDAGGMAAFSARGPCDDGRIKPDLCAPGTNILSARSHIPGANPSWGVYDANYGFNGGTSMSTGLAAGAVLIARQYCADVLGITPSAALLKALLINGAADMTPGQYGTGAKQEILSRPDNVQGWGRIDLANSLFPASPRCVDVVDDVAGISKPQSRTYKFQVLGAGAPLRVTLVWTDYPGAVQAGKALVNDLDLRVTTPGGSTLYGNGSPDRKNNVEEVQISAPQAGIYTVTVATYQVPYGPQPYALVVSGQLPATYLAGRVRTASGSPIAGAAVAITGNGVTTTTYTATNGRWFARASAGSYTVSAAKTGWTFQPASRAATIQSAGVDNLDFTGSAPNGQLSGTITTTVGGQIPYVVESAHPYLNNYTATYTIVTHESATRLRVHFTDIWVQNGFDFVEVLDINNNMIDQYTGVYTDTWSSWIPGSVAKIRLTSDAHVNDYGIYIDGYETDQVDMGGLSGALVTLNPSWLETYSNDQGDYTFTSVEPITHMVRPALPHWTFEPQFKFVDVPAGGHVQGVNFTARPPGAIAGRVTTGGAFSYANTVQSPHPYSNNYTNVWTITGPEGATRIRVHFQQISTEIAFDVIFVLDAQDNVVDTFTGVENDVWSSWIPGNVLKIMLSTDDTTTDYGFLSDRYEVEQCDAGVSGVTVTLTPSGRTAVTQGNGEFLFENVDIGTYAASAEKAFWQFQPSQLTVMVTPGATVQSVNFSGHAAETPLGALRSFPDGEGVEVADKIVTAGSDQLGDCFYVEEDDRSAGIRVVGGTAASGDRVSISGKMQTTNGEREVGADAVQVVSSQNPVPVPISLANRDCGGPGLSVVGLLARVWGRVIQSEPTYFRLDDGSASAGSNGLKVETRGLCRPSVGEYVIVTGVIGAYEESESVYPVLRIRTAADCATLPGH